MSYEPVMPSGSSQQPLPRRAKPEDEMNLKDVFSIVARRRRLVLSFMLIGGLLAALYAFSTPKRYSSTATIEVNAPANNQLGLQDLSGGATELSGPEAANSDLLTQQSEIASETTALAVIDMLKLTDRAPYAIPSDVSPKDPLYAERNLPLSNAPFQRDRVFTIFSANLAVGPVKGTRLITITYSDADPKRATEIANAVVAAYKDESAKNRLNASSEVSTWLSNQLQTLKQNVEQSQHEVEQYQNQTGLVGVTTDVKEKGQEQASPSVSIPVARLLQLNDDLTRAEVARIALEAIYRMTESKDPQAILGIPSTLASGPGGDSSLAPGKGGLVVLQELLNQESQLSVSITNSAARYGPKSATMLDLRSRYAATEKQIQAELGRISDRAKNDLILAQLGENGLRRRVAEQEQSVSQWSSKADHLLLLEGEAASSRQLYQDLFAKLQEANLAGGLKASRVTVIDEARVPALPSAPKKRADVLLGMLIGFVLGLISVFALDYVDDTIHGRAEAEIALGEPVLGTLPLTTRQRGRIHTPPWLEQSGSDAAQPILLSAPRSESAEAYRRLRIALLAGRQTVIAVESGSSLEGRAATTFNVASSFAMLKHRVLLIDADLHRISNDVSPSTGLSDLLVGRLQLKDVVQASREVPGLFILPSGKNPDSPGEMLSSGEFQSLLEHLKSEYEYIFIECPPALRYSDATVLARMAGAYVVVAQSGVTGRKDLGETLDALAHSEATLVGIVLNTPDAKSRVSARDGYRS